MTDHDIFDSRLEEIKLQDGIRLHENTKVELETYARQTGQPIVKPFLLVIARDTAHASQLLQLMQSEQFFEGRYKDKVIQVDSSRTGAEEDEMVQRLLAVESAAEPTEIVIHVNFQPFSLDTSGIYYQRVDRDLLIQHLRTHEQESLSFSRNQHQEQRLEDYLVRGLIDFDDISYDDHADLLYDLAGQMVKHLLSYLSEEEATGVLRYHQNQLVEFIHVQMQAHYWEKATGDDVMVSRGFTELKHSAYTTAVTDPIHDVRQTVPDRSRIAQMVCGGFQRCLYTRQKFQSDSERKLALILDREAVKWFKPARGQFQIFYKLGADHLEYQPDFVAETTHCTYMLEAKARNDMQDAEVQAKKDAAVQWCRHATSHTAGHGGKPWTYLLIPHDAITENMTLLGLANQFRIQ